MRMNTFLICFAVIASVFGTPGTDHLARAELSDTSPKKVALILPFEGYSHAQYSTIKTSLEPKGLLIKIVSTKFGKATVTPQSGTLQTELTIDKLDVAEFDALIFIGGTSGIQSEYVDNPHAHRIVKAAVRSNKIIAAL